MPVYKSGHFTFFNLMFNLYYMLFIISTHLQNATGKSKPVCIKL